MKFESFDKLYLVIFIKFPEEKGYEPNKEEEKTFSVTNFFQYITHTKFSIEGIYFDRDEAERIAVDECEVTPIDSGLYGVVEVKLENGALILPNLSAYHDCWQDFEVDSRYINTYLPALEEDE